MTCLVDVCAFDGVKKDKAATELHDVPHTSIQIPPEVWRFRFVLGDPNTEPRVFGCRLGYVNLKRVAMVTTCP